MAEYAVPTVAGGRGEVLPMVSAAFTGIEKDLLVVLLSESVTVMVKETVVVLVGVPVSTPLDERLKPAGNPDAVQV